MNLFRKFSRKTSLFLNHILKEHIQLVLAVAKVATLDVVRHLLAPSTAWVVQLEVPQEVVGVLELRADGLNLVDEILHTDDAVLAQLLLDDRVVGQGNALAVDLAKTTLVDKIANVLQRWVAPSDVGLGNAQHVDGGLVQLDKHAVVDLSQTEQLQHLAWLRWHTIDTIKDFRD